MADVKKINGYDINDNVSRTNVGCTADTYDPSLTYAINDIVIYEKTMYKCISAITTAEEWNSEHWEQICLRDLLIESRARVSATEPKDGLIWIKKGRNKYNKSKSTDGIYLTNTGAIAVSSNVSLSDYMEVVGGKYYTYQGITNSGTSPYSAWYDADFNFISSFKQATGVNSIQAPSNANYVRFSIRIDNTDKNTFQFERGTIAHDYEKYVKEQILIRQDGKTDIFQNIVDINKKIKELQDIIDNQLKKYLYLGLGEEISENADLNDFTAAGTYLSATASVSASLSNSPQSASAFKLVVEHINMENTRVRQTIYCNATDCATYVRYYNGTWGKWYKFGLTAV